MVKLSYIQNKVVTVMKLDVLTGIILEQQRLVGKVDLIHRNYRFDSGINYVLVGLRRAGKSYLLFQRIQELLSQGIKSEQIIYINFEDERLLDFQLSDFNDIIVAANQITSQKHYYFFDEIQNVDGWERFARRMADQKEFVYLTGSNSKMLGRDILMKLGGRYLTKYVAPFDFDEFLRAKKVPHDKNDLLIPSVQGQINGQLDEYLTFGGLPEAVLLEDKRNYLNSLYQNIYLADMIVRNHLRNPDALRLLIQKISETVMHEVSYTKLFHAVKSVGASTGKSSIIDYTDYAQNAYLLFQTKNYFTKFSERENTPRFYFTDNGLLNIFLTHQSAALLENLVAVSLFNGVQQDLYYLKSSKTGIDVDFYVPASRTAIQVTWTLQSAARQREIDNLVKLATSFDEVDRLVIVTKEDRPETIDAAGKKVEVVPLARFLLQNH